MPYRKKSQARAVLANTSEGNPRHAEARREAKKRLARDQQEAAIDQQYDAAGGRRR